MCIKSRSSLVFLAAFVLLLAITLAPLGAARYPGMVDYPNHLARIYILSELAGSAALSSYYYVLTLPVANLGMDVLVAPLVRLGLDLEAMARLFVGLAIVSFCAGVVLLGWVTQRGPPWFSLLIFPFVFNHYFLYGFLNYFFGLGVACMTLALWIRSEGANPWLRLAGFSVLSTVLLGIHLMAFGIYGLALAAYTAGKALRAREPLALKTLLVPLAQFVVPVLLYFSVFQHVPGQQFGYGNPLKTKLLGLFGAFLSYSWFWDGAFALTVALLLAWLIKGRHLAMPDAGGRFAVAAIAVAFLVLPFSALGSYMLDSRLSIAIVALALGFVSLPRIAAYGRRALPIALGLLFALVIQRASVVGAHWQSASDAFTEVRSALASMNPGARLATIYVKDGLGREFPPLRQAACFAVIDRAALVPNLFAFPFNGESVAFREHLLPVVSRYALPTVSAGYKPDWEWLSSNYDYVLLVGYRPENLPAGHSVVAAGDRFQLLATSTSGANPR